jgi:hypothetical protein
MELRDQQTNACHVWQHLSLNHCLRLHSGFGFFWVFEAYGRSRRQFTTMLDLSLVEIVMTRSLWAGLNFRQGCRAVLEL